MAWDAARPVPWRRLVREWAIYAAILAVGFIAFFNDRPLAGIIAGLAASGPLYIGLGAVLAKFGYERKSLRQLRADSVAARASAARGSKGAPSAPARPKPAATRRTGAGNPGQGGRRR